MELINVNVDKYLYNAYNSYNIRNVSNYNLCEMYYSNNGIINYTDLSDNFPPVYDQETYGITSSCAIASVLSYLHKTRYGNDKIFSPYFLACLQYNLTRDWNILDIQTGLSIVLNKGICLAESFDNTLNLNMIANENIHKEALNNRLTSYSKVNVGVNNITNLLNDKIPILCSMKILPRYNTKYFYECLDDNNYWLDCYNYYLENNDVYSVSITIVGYDMSTNKFKIRGCWGKQIGNDGYLYISFEIIDYFKSLFFDSFIVDLTEPTVSKIKIKNTSHIHINENYDSDDDCIIEFNRQTTPLSCKRTSSFSKTRSFSGFNDSIIDIDIYDNLDDIINSEKNESLYSNIECF